MTIRLDERFDEGVLWWFGHVERMENARIAKRVYIRDCAGSHSVGRLRKRWIDTVKEFKKRGFGVKQARRMVNDWNEWQGFVRGNAWDVVWGMTPDLDELPQLYEALEGWKSCLWLSLQVKGHKGIIFSFYSALLLLLISWHDVCQSHSGGRR